VDQDRTSVLVVAHQTAATSALEEAVHERAMRSPATFHLLVPRRRRGGEQAASPDDVGRQEADEVLRDALPRLSRAAGGEVTGEIGGTEPLAAIKEALAVGDYKEVIISTLPLGVSKWLKEDLVARAEVLGPPVRHVLGRESRLTAANS